MRTKPSSRGPGIALVFLGYISLVAGGDQPVPVPAARRRAHRCGRSPRRCAASAISLAAMYRFSSVGHRAVAVPRDQRRQQRHRPPRRLSRLHRSGARTHTQLLTSGPTRSAQRRAEQRLELRSPEQRDLLPAAGGAQAPVAPAQRHRQPVRDRQQRVRLEREREGGRLHEPAASDAAQLGREGGAQRRRHVLDHARAVHEVELVSRERQPGGGVGAHERAGVGGPLDEVDAGDVEPARARAGRAAAAEIEHARARPETREREETRVAAGAGAGGEGGGQARERAAGGGVDARA